MGKLADNLKGIISELSPGGGARAVLVTGTSKDTGHAIDQMSISLTGANPSCLWVEIDGRYNNSPKILMANFARKIKGGNAFKMKDLGEFGRDRKDVSQEFPPTNTRVLKGGWKFKFNKPSGDADAEFRKLASTVQEKGKRPITTFCFSNLSSFTSEMLDWICLDLNNALRKSNICRGARFVFTDRDKSNNWANFLTGSGLKKLKDSKSPQKECNPVKLKLGCYKRKS